MIENYYSILGVQETATADEIKARYRFLSQAYHPDKFQSVVHRQIAENEFKRINEAYQFLSDPSLRARLDASRNQSAPRSAHESPPSSQYTSPPSTSSRNTTNPPPPQPEDPPQQATPVSTPTPRSVFVPTFFVFWILLTIFSQSLHNDIVASILAGAALSVAVSSIVSAVIDGIVKHSRK